MVGDGKAGFVGKLMLKLVERATLQTDFFLTAGADQVVAVMALC